jgi:lambda family phage portal protein
MPLPTQVSSVFGTNDRLRADYDGARDSRFRRQRRGVTTVGLPADYHYRSYSDHLRLMELARDMDRNDPFLGQLIDRSLDNIVQLGFTIDPSTGDKAFDADLKKRWYEWSEDRNQVDLAGECSFPAFERAVLRQQLIDGDVFMIPTSEGSLQGIEAHRCRTPSRTTRNVIHGVLLDDFRRRLEYWFTKQDIQPYGKVSLVSEMTPYPARDKAGYRNVFQIYEAKRFSQTRGITALAPIFDFIGMGGDAVFAKIVQQLIANCFAIFRERDKSFASDSPDVPTGELTNEPLVDGGSRLTQGISPGMEVIGKPGEKLQGFSPNLGNTDFMALVQFLLSVIGANLGMPLIMVLMDTGDTNFSSWRGAFDQAKMGFRRRQQCLASQFHTEVYNWKVRQWITSSDAMYSKYKSLGNLVFKHTWGMPSWPYVDPYKDASADLLQMRNGLMSPRRIQANKGCDHAEIVKETTEDNALVIESAITEADGINARHPDLREPIHWREVMSLPMPEGQKIADIPIDPPPAPAMAPAKTTGAARNEYHAARNGSPNGL